MDGSLGFEVDQACLIGRSCGELERVAVRPRTRYLALLEVVVLYWRGSWKDDECRENRLKRDVRTYQGSFRGV